MKINQDRFNYTFKSLKHEIDLIPMTAYQREDVMRNLIEMKMLFEQLNEVLKEKNKDDSKNW